MADNNVPSIQTAQANVRGGMNVTDPVSGTYSIPAQLNLSMSYGQGSTAGNINVLCALQALVPSGGSMTFNLNTGAISVGSGTVTINNNTTTTMLMPDGVTFTTTGLRDFLVVIPAASGSSSAHFSPAASNGFTGWLGGTTPTDAVRGGTNGGFVHRACSDSIGWPVSASLANLVLTNDDGAHQLTAQLFFAGA